jgi:luciferase-like monooxygenase
VHGSYAQDILPAFIVLPLGAGMAFLSVTNAAVAGVKEQEAGLASALLNTSQQVGGALGLAILSTIAAARTTSVLAAHPQAGLAPALVEGFQRAFVVGAGFAAAGAVLALLTISRQVGRAAAPEAPRAGALGAAARIAAAVESWEGATSHAHSFGDIELRAGATELGYLHGDAVADLLLPANVREEAIARGLAHPHHVLPESNWVNVHLHHPERIHDVIALLRSAYERAMASPVHRQVV